MKRLTVIVFAVLLLASVTLAEDMSLDEVREEVLQRIQAANVSMPLSPKGHGGRNLQSYRIIDPYIIADLLTGLIMIYNNILFNYPEFLNYDFAELRLNAVRYVPQHIEFNYVKRV
uniref:Uncharacterized protein n=1 Tax=Anopheles culicifacies TaxID=139723 RepID=A0A182M309_9DIPT